MELEVDAVPLAIEYLPLEITSAPHKEVPIADEEEQVTKPVQGSYSFNTPKTSLANTAEEAHPVPNSVSQPTTRLSTSFDSVEFILQQGSTSSVPVRSPIRTRGRTTQIPEEFNPQGNIHVSVSDNSSEESAKRDDMDVEGDRIDVSKVVSHKFYFDYTKEMWECVSQRILWFERSIRLSDLEDRRLDSILIDRQLIGYVTDIKPYVPQVVKEFYCNLHFDIIKVDSGKFGNVYVRVLTNWTPTANHTVLVKDQAILLYCIGMRHLYDLGRHIMRTIAKHVEMKTITGHLPFPSLIYNVWWCLKVLRSLERNNWNILELIILYLQQGNKLEKDRLKRKKFYILLPNSKVLLPKLQLLLLLNHFPLIVLALLLRYLVILYFWLKRESIAIVGAAEVGTSGAGGVHAEPRVATAAEIGGEALEVDTQQVGEGQAEADKEA
ncbi:hypothetical protein Pfo_031312 [Paulownia fortunei]|nr:hypothetical protein Pfo_031312 [Paulownia fortunei]